MLKRKKAQSALEYALVIAAAAAGLLSMSTYLKNSIQHRLKVSGDQISKHQFEPQHFNITWERNGGVGDISALAPPPVTPPPVVPPEPPPVPPVPPPAPVPVKRCPPEGYRTPELQVALLGFRELRHSFPGDVRARLVHDFPWLLEEQYNWMLYDHLDALYDWFFKGICNP